MRKQFLFGLAAIGVAALSGPAVAADLPMKAPAAAPAYYAPSWAGFYIGGNIGVTRQEARWDDFDQGALVSGSEGAGGCIFDCNSNVQNKTGFIGGGQIGWNLQSGSLVYGVEADISGLDGKMSTDFSPLRGNLNTSITQGIDWLATFRGRAGLAVDRTMVYITGGAAVGGVKNAVASVCAGDALAKGRCDSTDNIFLGSDDTRWGWTIGGGIEHMLTPNWTLRAEGLFVDLGQTGVIRTINTSSNETFSGRFSNQVVIGRLGVNYKFGDFGGPVVAKY
jgi:outer membrane immunogenic protein